MSLLFLPSTELTVLVTQTQTSNYRIDRVSNVFSVMTSTYGGLLARFSRGVTILRSVLPQIAAHRKVLEHTISRIKLWVEAVAETSRDEECTEDEVRAGGAIIAAMAAIKSTMSEYSMQSWVEPTLSNSVHAFMRAIQVQLRIVRDNAGVFGGDLVELLEVGEDLWVVLHGADLRAGQQEILPLQMPVVRGYFQKLFKPLKLVVSYLMMIFQTI